MAGLHFSFRERACNVKLKLRSLAGPSAKSAMALQKPDFFYALAAHARIHGQRIARVRGKSSAQLNRDKFPKVLTIVLVTRTRQLGRLTTALPALAGGTHRSVCP
jgi:hypothetical protein